MTIIFPVIELVDRYSIAKLKFDKTGSNAAELEFYKTQLDQFDTESITFDLLHLYDIHSEIWSLEADLKRGTEANLSLEEIGRRAIKIRDWNNRRVALKNSMAEKLGCNIREVKKDHLSQ
jgi:hypothetical protein